MAAKNVDAARRVPLLAAIPRIFLPLLLILPGAIAIGLPTPRTTTMTRIEDGAILHNTTVVRPEAEAGDGLVPARVDPSTRKLVRTASGDPALDYEMATPTMVAHFLPAGLLGLGLTALLACLISGMAANLTAFSAVFTCDLYLLFIGKESDREPAVVVGRWAALGGVLLSVGTAFAVARLSGLLEALIQVFSVVGVPLFAAVLLGMFWKRATGHGAFTGLIAGAGAALLHHGLTLPAGAQPGLRGGWIAVLGHYPGGMAQCFWTAILALGVSVVVTVGVSFCTKARPEKELAGLVYSLTPKPKRAKVWWQRPGALAVGVLLIAAAVSLLLF
jgi:SSS family solute:Na+ symporter